MRRRWSGIVLAVLAMVGLTSNAARTPQVARAAATGGYWLVATDGGVFSYGDAGFHGSTGDVRLNQPIVGMTPTSSGKGYWMVASDGGIFSFGDASFFGSTGGIPLNQPIVGMSPTPTGRGYWLVASDGGIFAFGDAPFLGSTGNVKLNKPIVDMAVTPTGKGYWLVASDGGIFAFGDAAFFGSTGDVDLTQRIHAMAANPNGKGYWLVAGDGGVFAFGDAKFYGSGAGATEKRVLDIAPSGTGLGYFMTTSSGEVLNFGDARHFGDVKTTGVKLNNRIAAMAAMSPNSRAILGEDNINLDEDQTVTIDVLGNDKDPDGGVLVLKSVTSPLRGTATITDGKVVYKPNADINGNDFFVYTVVEEGGSMASGRVNLTIAAVDDKPDPEDDEINLLEDGTLRVPVLRNDAGLGDGVALVEVTGQPGNGKATVDGEYIVYQANPDFTGEDRFEYQVTDVDGDSGTGRVKAVVSGGNDMPVAVDDAAAVEFGRTVEIPVQSNDEAADGVKEIRLVDDSGAPIDRASLTTALGGEVRRDKGKIEYKAPTGTSPFEDSFRYVVVDRDGDVSAPATVRVTVGENPAPRLCTGCDPYIVVEQGKTYKVPADQLRKLVESDQDEALEFQPTTGNAQQGDNGSIVYGPAPAQGEDSFTFVAHDGNSASNERTVRVCIKPDADTPPPTGCVPEQQ
jgi:hypothetical protein